MKKALIAETNPYMYGSLLQARDLFITLLGKFGLSVEVGGGRHGQ